MCGFYNTKHGDEMLIYGLYSLGIYICDIVING